MAERRSLTEGLIATPTPVDREAARQFIHGEKPPASVQTPAHLSNARMTSNGTDAPTTAPAIGRVPISTRMRADFAAALKRASLERQLSGQEPNTLTDIIEQAIEPWLKSNGYLS